jgi:hypothetical protein
MNENEKEFMERLRDVETNIYAPYEMEIEHYYNDDDSDLDGWYVCKYNGENGEVISDDNDPIITDVEAERLGIDVIKCLNEYGCYYMP